MDATIGPVVTAPRATATAGPDAPTMAAGVEPAPLDVTADATQDTVSTYADAVSRRAELFMLAAQTRQQDQQLRLDRMRANFNEAQERQSERLREMNAIRDMAIEQAKKDDDILKKFIAMI